MNTISICSSIKKLLRSIDLFGIPTSLALGRSLKYKSKFSGFISFIVYIVILVILVIEMIRTINGFII